MAKQKSKKKANKKKGSKKKASKKKGSEKEDNEKKLIKPDEQKPKEPTVTDKLNAAIQELQKEFHVVDSVLQQRENILNSLKEHRNRELKRKEACVNYLKKILKTKTDECQQLQSELRLIRDLNELTENKASNYNRDIEKKGDIAKSLFLQEKSELEGNLSALEEKRLKKNVQLPRLNRLEEELAEIIAAKQEQNREENKNRINQILEKQAKFEHLLDELCAESIEVFDLNLPVFAKKQLSENVRLRNLCQKVSENLLQVHDQNRNLSMREKSLRIESETQNKTEISMKSLERRLNNRLQKLLDEEGQLEIDVSNYGMVGDDEDMAIKQLAIDVRKGMLCKVEDHLVDLLKIQKDQEEYILLLQKELANTTNRNGSMLSAILRSAQIVRSRMKEPYRSDETYMDFELLRQIRLLLTDYSSVN